MAFEPGGRADKLGNRYEGLWVAKQLLELLKEELQSVTVEAIGDDEIGVDMWVVSKEGVRFAHQCKARNKSKPAWTIADLGRAGVIGKMEYQLKRDPNCQAVFVSAVSAIELCDMCHSARNSTNDSGDFLKHQLKSENRQRLFNAYQQNIEEKDPESRRVFAVDYLRRTHTVQYAGDQESRAELLSQISFLLTGNRELILHYLMNYIIDTDQLGKAVDSHTLYRYLREQGVHPKKLAHDSRIQPKLEHLRNEYRESYEPYLILDRIISRDETDQCWDALESHGLVVLHGPAGTGKSGVLYELTQRLGDAGVNYLPLRLDRQRPLGTARTYGESLGLPDSPAFCLHAAGTASVLILDQLDAIRWTSNHSSDALSVCREMLRDVLALRREDKSMRVIIACRTFDMENDIELKKWLGQQDDEGQHLWKRIEVKPLDKERVSQIIGDKYNELRPRQQELLSNPHRLFMWLSTLSSGRVSTASTQIGLLQDFWENKLSTLARMGFAQDEVKATVKKVAIMMFDSGRLQVRRMAVGLQARSLLDGLKSVGILADVEQSITFAHQSYYDYLVVVDLIQDLYTPERFVQWLGPKGKQDLSRREQIRLLLGWIEQESLGLLTEIITTCLKAESVRFHIKQLALEILGATEGTLKEVLICVETLIKDEIWRDRVLETVCQKRTDICEYLLDQGYFADWLQSGDTKVRGQALSLLGHASNGLPGKTSKLFNELISQGGDWPGLVLQSLGWGVVEEPDELFAVHASLLREHGLLPYFIHWTELCAKRPERALELVVNILRRSDERGQGPRLEHLSLDDISSLKKVARTYPERAWIELRGVLSPVDAWRMDDEHKGIRECAVDMVLEAGRELAATQPDFFGAYLESTFEGINEIHKTILAVCLSCLPAAKSDLGISWLLADLKRLSLGEAIGEREFSLARTAILALSPYCGNALFKLLEEAVYQYRDLELNRKAKWSLKERRKGVFYPYWGHAQYVLLTALCPHRVSRKTQELIQVLSRTYNTPPESLIEPHRVVTGWIGSKIHDSAHLLSDKQWLRIVRNRQVASRSHRYTKDWLEASVEQFSRDLERVAKRLPERFGQLALQFPENTPAGYIAAIFSALGETTPEASDDAGSWAPASAATVRRVVLKFNMVDDRGVALGLCRLITKRKDVEWPPTIFSRLIELSHSAFDLRTNELVVHRTGWAGDLSSADVDDLESNAINGVRGVVAEAASVLIWNDSSNYEKLQPALETLWSDHHPAVRVASIQALTAVYNMDRDFAVARFCQMAIEDPRVAASRHGIHFMNYAIRSHPEAIKSVVQSMLGSHAKEVQEMGAKAVAAYYLGHGHLAEELETCLHGSTDYRKGVADIAVRFAATSDYTATCLKWIEALLNDPDKDVRDTISRVFLQREFDIAPNLDFVLKYASSPCVSENSSLWYKLSEYAGPLLPLSEIILALCNALVKNDSDIEVDRSYYQYHADQVTRLLIRLYDESYEHAPGVFTRCLDTWDTLFEAGTSRVRALTKAMDSFQGG